MKRSRSALFRVFMEFRWPPMLYEWPRNIRLASRCLEVSGTERRPNETMPSEFIGGES